MTAVSVKWAAELEIRCWAGARKSRIRVEAVCRLRAGDGGGGRLLQNAFFAPFTVRGTTVYATSANALPSPG